MRTIRYYRRLFTVFLARFKFVLLGSLGLSLLIFFFFSRFDFPATFFSPAEKIGLVGNFSLDNLPRFIQDEISVGLTRLDKNGNVLPGAASSWRYEDNGRVWIFKLRDLKWQDGKMLRASDVNYNFSDVKTEVVDDNTVKFILQDPYAPFPVVVSKPLFRNGLVGLGNWKVAKFARIRGRLTKSLKLIKWGGTDIKVYKFYPTEKSARIAFKLGEVDKLVHLLDPKELSEWPNIQVVAQSHRDQYIGVFFNTRDSTLSSKSLRQALAYAINKQDFGLERAVSTVSPNSWAFNPQVKKYEYNPERARELLKKVFKDEEKRDISINLVTTPSLLSIADKIKGYWESIGVQVHIQVSNFPPSDFQALLIIEQIPADPDQYSRWHSTQEQTNITHYSKEQKESQRIDKLLEDGRKTLNKEERKKIYLDFQRFLLEDLPVIPLFHPETYTISRK